MVKIRQIYIYIFTYIYGIRLTVGLVELLNVGVLNLGLGGQPRAAGAEGNNLLGSHAAGLGRKVDPFARALGHVAGGVANQRDAADDAARAHVLGDGVSLDFHDLQEKLDVKIRRVG